MKQEETTGEGRPYLPRTRIRDVRISGRYLVLPAELCEWLDLSEESDRVRVEYHAPTLMRRSHAVTIRKTGREDARGVHFRPYPTGSGRVYLYGVMRVIGEVPSTDKLPYVMINTAYSSTSPKGKSLYVTLPESKPAGGWE